MNRHWRWMVVLCLVSGGFCGLSSCRDRGPSQPTTPAKSQADTPPHKHAGGSEADEHEHPLPQNFADAVVELKECYRQIKEACEKNNAAEADEPLHNVGNLLESLTALAGKSGLTDDQLKSVQTATDKMFDAYAHIDEAIHDKKPPDYASVAAKLEESLAVIEAVAAKSSQEQAHPVQ